MADRAGRAQAVGVRVDWSRFFAGASGPGRPAHLPVRAAAVLAERRGRPVAGGADRLGLSLARHPLLDAAVELGDADEVVLTGACPCGPIRGSPSTGCWARILLPGTALWSWLGTRVPGLGCPHVAELLRWRRPLWCPTHGAVAVQVVVRAPDPDGQRSLSVHARPAGTDQPWTRRASGRWARPPSGCRTSRRSGHVAAAGAAEDRDS